MNFDKESKSDFFFFWGGGGVGVGGGGVGEGVGGVEWREGGFQTEKKLYSLTFCAYALYKISSSKLKWFSSLTQTKE